MEKRLLIDSSFVKSMGTKIYSQIFIEFIVSKMNVKTLNYMSGNYVINLLKKEGFYINNTKKDLAKNDRCIISTKK